MRYLAIIPARGGSKGIPKKNIKLLNNEPLIYHTIKVAREVLTDSDICVSTDCEEIKSVVEEIGLLVPFLRPLELATDTARTYDVLLHAIDFYKSSGKYYDAIILLQPTSPLRTTQHIQEAISLFSMDIDMVVSVKETKSNPYYVLFEEDERGFLQKSKKGNFTRRQDCPKVWEYNGAVYVINTKSLEEKAIHQFSKIKKYEMDEWSSIDIDSELDWELAEILLKKVC